MQAAHAYELVLKLLPEPALIWMDVTERWHHPFLRSRFAAAMDSFRALAISVPLVAT
jgi:hypothetical protein